MIFIVSSHSDCKGNYNMQLELFTKVPRCSARVTAMQLINGFTMELIDRQSKVFKNLKAIDQAELAFVLFCFFFLCFQSWCCCRSCLTLSLSIILYH